MATLPVAALDAAAILLAALLAAVAADSALRGASDRASSEKDNAKSAARAIPIPSESTDRCPPERGRLVTRRWRMSDVSREYQARITGFNPYTEWLFEKIELDGFVAPECRLQEAKARYDQFFNPETGLPKDFFLMFGGLESTLNQARAQSWIVKRNPPSKLTWHFMEPISYIYFSRRFKTEGLTIQSFLNP